MHQLAPQITTHSFKAGIGFRLSRASMIVQSAVEKALASHGLTRLSWIILASIHFDQKNTVTEVSKHSGIERTAVSRMTSQLERDGILERTQHSSDRRSSRLTVTSKGLELCDKTPKIIQKACEPLFLDLSPNQIALLGELLDQIQSDKSSVWHGS